MLVNGHVMQNARENYVADMLYVIASGKRLSAKAKPFSAILGEREKKPKDSRSGEEILSGLLARLESEEKNESI